MIAMIAAAVQIDPESIDVESTLMTGDYCTMRVRLE
jgi:hypothetical protein